jgi:hypothetical protein
VIARLLETAPIWGSTIAPAVVVVSLLLFIRPKPAPAVLPRPVVRCDCCPAHRRGVRASRIVRRLEGEWARRPRPTGYSSPLFTVPREATR